MLRDQLAKAGDDLDEMTQPTVEQELFGDILGKPPSPSADNMSLVDTIAELLELQKTNAGWQRLAFCVRCPIRHDYPR